MPASVSVSVALPFAASQQKQQQGASEVENGGGGDHHSKGATELGVGLSVTQHLEGGCRRMTSIRLSWVIFGHVFLKIKTNKQKRGNEQMYDTFHPWFL